MTIEQLVRAVYAALAAGDAAALHELLDPEFEARFSDGMPAGGGAHAGAEDAISNGWWAIGRSFRVLAQPEQWLHTTDGKLVVVGTYRGTARGTRAPVEAAFAHLWTERDGRLVAVRQITDTAKWAQALEDR